MIGTGDMTRVRVRDYFNDLRETVNRQEEAGLAVVDGYLRDQLSWLRQRQEDMVVLNSHTSAVCSHCEKTLKSDDSQVSTSLIHTSNFDNNIYFDSNIYYLLNYETM